MGAFFGFDPISNYHSKYIATPWQPHTQQPSIVVGRFAWESI